MLAVSSVRCSAPQPLASRSAGARRLAAAPFTTRPARRVAIVRAQGEPRVNLGGSVWPPVQELPPPLPPPAVGVLPGPAAAFQPACLLHTCVPCLQLTTMMMRTLRRAWRP